jgi:cellulose synthase/poly-beta-1,6-N-acetylglucosamine synthase-like glycosyltransferase
MIEGLCLLILLMCGIYSGHRLFLLGIYLYAKHNEKNRPPKYTVSSAPPKITIQLPVFNERYVVKRLIDAVCSIRYPRHLLEIQVLDDSDDDTCDILDTLVETYRIQGHPIQTVRRGSRTGYKAGALQHGLRSAKGEWILIFDSDFIPQPDLLESALPYLNDSGLGMIQFCWDHINRNFSLFTRIQALFLDGHFHIEHFSRNRSGRFFNFNGTAGMWRRSCIIDSGGWQYDTLTEDMDLSYRAQMRGWKFLYAPDIRVPAELPVELAAFKSQQFRWAKGSIQTARKILPRLFRSDQPWRIKIEGGFHMLSNVMYMVLPLMILVMPFVLGHMSLVQMYLYRTVLMFSLVSITAFYLFAGWHPWAGSRIKLLIEIPLLMAVGIGLCVNNSEAVIKGIFSNAAVFVRTPKYNVVTRKDRWQHNIYRIRRVPLFWMEAFFLAYLVVTMIYSIRLSALHMLPYLAIFTTGFAYFVTLNLKQAYSGKG